LIEEYITKVFFFIEDYANTGMSEELFFTKIYFWLFFAVIVGVHSLISESPKGVRVSFFALSIVGFLFLYTQVPALSYQFFLWSFFASYIIYKCIKDQKTSARNAFLLASSLFFYYKTSGFFFLILVFSTLVDYTIGLSIHSSKRDFLRKILLVFSVSINLLVLAYFKYAYFFTSSYNEFIITLNHAFGTVLNDVHVNNLLAEFSNNNFGSHFRVDKILLPVGISFYTFQTISYSVDIYRKQLEPVKNILDFGFYVSFFPQLVAGPIVRASQFIPQLYKEHKVNKYEFGLGLFWILNGLLKKAFLADFIANGFIDGVFADPSRYSGFENVMAVFGYSLQVYADFSGYTDIAIGIALIIGFRLNVNFNSPYKSIHVGEFWKRWHISLSSWLKDYLYIPLGGNKKGTLGSYLCLTLILFFIILLSGKAWIPVAIIILTLSGSIIVFAMGFPKVRAWLNTNINLMVTMIFGGLWHGSSWNYVIWGTLNGLGLVVYKLWKRISPWENRTWFFIRPWKIFVTLVFISFTRIFFRAPNMEVAGDMMHQIGTDMNLAIIGQVITAFWGFYLVMVLGYVIHWLPSSFKVWYRHYFIKLPVLLKMLVTIIAVYLCYQSLQGAQPFIYFQF